MEEYKDLKDLKYHYIDPTGNITVLVESEVPFEKHVKVSSDFCKKFPECEQVGFVSDGDGCDIRLKMAGGEFCGNATMSTAALYAKKNNTKIGDKKTVIVKVFGTEKPVEVSISRQSENTFEGTVLMPDPIGYEERVFSFAGKDHKMALVKFKGIYQLISEEPFEKETAEAAVIKWCEELKADALGIMQLDEEKSILTPLVYVPALKDFYWEHACASGTTAAGYYLYKKYGKPVTVDFKEPGGILNIKVTGSGTLYLTGHVTFTDK